MTEVNANNGEVAKADLDVIVYLDPKEVGRSPFNREGFDPEKMAKLIESVRARGIIQPALVRENPGYFSAEDVTEPGTWKLMTADEQTTVMRGLPEFKALKLSEDFNKPKYEIIAGERRWHAATECGIKLPATIRNLTDADTVTIQGIENMQREDLNALDEAEKFRQLREIYRAQGMAAKQSVLAVAEAFNVGKTRVYDALALFDLDEETRSEVRAGIVSPTHAGFLLRIDDPVTRAKTLKAMKDQADEGEKIVGTREAEDMVAAVVAQAEKEKRWFAAVDEAMANGWEVLTEKQTPQIYNEFQVLGQFVILSRPCPYLAREEGVEIIPVSWEEALGKLAPNRVLAKMRNGDPIFLYRREAAMVALKQTDHKLALPEEALPQDTTAEQLKQEKAEADKLRRKELSKVFAMDAFIEAKNCEGPGGWKLVWEFLHAHMFWENYLADEEIAWVLTVHGVNISPADDPEEQLFAYGQGLDGKRLRGLVVQCLLLSFHYEGWATMESGERMPSWTPMYQKAADIFPGLEIPAWNEEDEKPKDEAKPKAKKAAEQKVAKDTKGKTAKAKGSSQKEAKGAKGKATKPAATKGKKGGAK